MSLVLPPNPSSLKSVSAKPMEVSIGKTLLASLIRFWACSRLTGSEVVSTITATVQWALMVGATVGVINGFVVAGTGGTTSTGTVGTMTVTGIVNAVEVGTAVPEGRLQAISTTKASKSNRGFDIRKGRSEEHTS